MDKPPSPVMVLNPQCMAAAALFEAASLRAERMARELPAGSPEAAVKLGLAAIYDTCMRDMTRLAREFVSPARVAGEPATGGEHV